MARTIEPAAAAESAPPPRANPDLVGHESAERELERLYRAGRAAACDPAGRPARHRQGDFGLSLCPLRAGPRRQGADAARISAAADETGLAIDPESGAFRRVAAGGHADLLTVERAWDPGASGCAARSWSRIRARSASFLRLTAAEEGWRIVIIDGAEEMNRNAANAVLKILEEPPSPRVAAAGQPQPGPAVADDPVALPATDARGAGRWRWPPAVGALPPRTRRGRGWALAAACAGSIGRALELAERGGLALYRSLVELLVANPGAGRRGAARLRRPARPRRCRGRISGDRGIADRSFSAAWRGRCARRARPLAIPARAESSPSEASRDAAPRPRAPMPHAGPSCMGKSSALSPRADDAQPRPQADHARRASLPSPRRRARTGITARALDRLRFRPISGLWRG